MRPPLLQLYGLFMVGLADAQAQLKKESSQKARQSLVDEIVKVHVIHLLGITNFSVEEILTGMRHAVQDMEESYRDFNKLLGKVSVQKPDERTPQVAKTSWESSNKGNIGGLTS